MMQLMTDWMIDDLQSSFSCFERPSTLTSQIHCSSWLLLASVFVAMTSSSWLPTCLLDDPCKSSRFLLRTVSVLMRAFDVIFR